MSTPRRARPPIWVRPLSKEAVQPGIRPGEKPLPAEPLIGQEVQEIPIERVKVALPVHQAGWPRRAELVSPFEKWVAGVRASGEWPGMPIRVRQEGDDYILVTGFSRLAVAVEAGLPTVRAVVEPPPEEVPLAQIRLSPRYQAVRKRKRKLLQRLEVLQKTGSLHAPLQVRPARQGEPAGYILLDGLYWYYAAQEFGLEKVPVVVHR